MLRVVDRQLRIDHPISISQERAELHVGLWCGPTVAYDGVSFFFFHLSRIPS